MAKLNYARLSRHKKREASVPKIASVVNVRCGEARGYYCFWHLIFSNLANFDLKKSPKKHEFAERCRNMLKVVKIKGA